MNRAKFPWLPVSFYNFTSKIHRFCDARECEYVWVVYRLINVLLLGILTKLFCTKLKVDSSKMITISRLDLCFSVINYRHWKIFKKRMFSKKNMPSLTLSFALNQRFTRKIEDFFQKTWIRVELARFHLSASSFFVGVLCKRLSCAAVLIIELMRGFVCGSRSSYLSLCAKDWHVPRNSFVIVREWSVFLCVMRWFVVFYCYRRLMVFIWHPRVVLGLSVFGMGKKKHFPSLLFKIFMFYFDI